MLWLIPSFSSDLSPEKCLDMVTLFGYYTHANSFVTVTSRS